MGEWGNPPPTPHQPSPQAVPEGHAQSLQFKLSIKFYDRVGDSVSFRIRKNYHKEVLIHTALENTVSKLLGTILCVLYDSVNLYGWLFKVEELHSSFYIYIHSI